MELQTRKKEVFASKQVLMKFISIPDRKLSETPKEIFRT